MPLFQFSLTLSSDTIFSLKPAGFYTTETRAVYAAGPCSNFPICNARFYIC